MDLAKYCMENYPVRCPIEMIGNYVRVSVHYDQEAALVHTWAEEGLRERLLRVPGMMEKLVPKEGDVIARGGRQETGNLRAAPVPASPVYPGRR